jgi:hypothetical protein
MATPRPPVDHQQAKLALCVELAGEVWGGL